MSSRSPAAAAGSHCRSLRHLFSVYIMLVEVVVGPKTMDIHLPLVSVTTKGLAFSFSTPNPMALFASKVEMAL